MPLIKMKKVWDYCTYNKPFFLFVIILLCILNFTSNYYYMFPKSWRLLEFFIIPTITTGYGMTITRDRINQGVRLPKILIKDVLVLGVKSIIVFNIYLFIQGSILDFVCSPFNFPTFELEDMLLDLPNTLNLLYSHNPVHTLIFLVLGSILFYITSFFMEIAIARLADTGSILTAFKFAEIKRDIDTLGWRHYTKDYTLIILALVIFSSLSYLTIPVSILDYVWKIALKLFLLATQFLGIGAVYAEIKEKKQSQKQNS